MTMALTTVVIHKSLDKRIETFLQVTSHQPTKYFSPPTNKNASITILAKEK